MKVASGMTPRKKLNSGTKWMKLLTSLITSKRKLTSLMTQRRNVTSGTRPMKFVDVVLEVSFLLWLVPRRKLT